MCTRCCRFSKKNETNNKTTHLPDRDLRYIDMPRLYQPMRVRYCTPLLKSPQRNGVASVVQKTDSPPGLGQSCVVEMIFMISAFFSSGSTIGLNFNWHCLALKRRHAIFALAENFPSSSLAFNNDFSSCGLSEEGFYG